MRHIRLSRSAVTVSAIVVGLLSSGGMMLAGSYAAFSDTTANANNNWSAGTVVIADDDTGSAMFTTAAVGTGQVSGTLKPGQTIANCVRVTYNGSLPSTVKLYATNPITETAPNGTGLLPYLHIRVEEGTAGDFGCANFAGASTIWDSTTHPGAASDLLGVFPTSYAGGINSGLASWSAGTYRVYRFTMTLDSATPDTSQGATATATFNWQAQNT